MAASYNTREVTGGVSCGDFGMFQVYHWFGFIRRWSRHIMPKRFF